MIRRGVSNKLLIERLLPVRFISSYVQGQSPEKRIREYFYYVDHHGQLFLDDARMKNFTSCFKDKVFLAFFFEHLGRNTTGRYQDDFPYVSLCGRERNFVRCDDLPIVYTQVDTDPSGNERFIFCNGGLKLSVVFNAEDICMRPNGRIYYPADEKYGGVGLIRSALAIEFSKLFLFENGLDNPPTHILWNQHKILLNNKLSSFFS